MKVLTNEELAEKIKNGDSSLVTILWQRVYRLLYMKSDRVYSSCKERCIALGIEPEDIKQECYFVFVKALGNYRPPYKFTTYLEFPFRDMVSRLMKFKARSENIYNTSFEKKLYDDALHFEEIYSDIQKDVQNDTQQITEKKTNAETVRAAVLNLKGKQRQVISLYYFHGMADTQIAEKFGCASASVCQLRHRALANLRNHPLLNMLGNQSEINRCKISFSDDAKLFLKGDIL